MHIYAFNDCNNIIKEAVFFIKNNLDLCGWICACLIPYKMYYPSDLIFETLERYTLNLSKPHIQRLYSYTRLIIVDKQYHGSYFNTKCEDRSSKYSANYY